MLIYCKLAVRTNVRACGFSKLREKNRELAEKTEYAKEQERVTKEQVDKKEELKSRALETIKE